jgi:pSer/pThr/pTyr-binding forkhead associated (FHA) protein
VSKSHAFFEDDGSGGFTLQDARSTNGTYVNGKRVPRSGTGLPAPVKTGDLVRFGTVELSFIDVRSFRDLIRVTLK